MVAIYMLKTDFDKVKKSMIVRIKFLFFLFSMMHSFCSKIYVFPGDLGRISVKLGQSKVKCRAFEKNYAY